jgi:protein SCO1/2
MYVSRFLFALLFAALCLCADRTYQASGLVLNVDASRRIVTISEDNIPGFMDPMVMSYPFPSADLPPNLHPGTKIEFTLTVGKESSSISNLRIRKFESDARDPVQVRTLNLLESTLNGDAGKGSALAIGQPVPDFTLTDQNAQPVTLSAFRGKLVGLTFIYTRCPLPDYCFRLSNNFGQLQKRFSRQLGRDLILLSISFDPVHDTPEILRQYAATWKADPTQWHFLTGSRDDVKRICSLFGMNFWPDEGLLTHSLHTVLINRQGKLSANIEGNQFTAGQLGDLVETLLPKP